jgi:16S rRNA (guanine(966)-N(2))-methyltransferase RsmD
MKLKTPKGINTRPTVDRVKESAFNILSSIIPDSDVLDLFSGTGALAVEALSRGAKSAVFVDDDRNCCSIIRENLEHTHLSGKAKVYCKKAGTLLKELGRNSAQFDIVFMDPPYLKNFIRETVQLLAENDIIKDKGIVMIEHHRNETVPNKVGALEKVRTVEYGDTVVSFLICDEYKAECT